MASARRTGRNKKRFPGRTQCDPRRQRLAFEMLESRRLLAVTPQLVKDINTATGNSNPGHFTTFQDSTFFAAHNGLWRSDLSPSGTELVRSLPGSASRLAPTTNNLFFTVQNSNFTGHGLWVSDGTEQGTMLLADRFANISSSLLVWGDKVYFNSSATSFGQSSLWVSDGTPLGTQPALLSEDETFNASFADSVLLNGIRIFSAFTAEHGSELWRTDGTVAGTYLLKDIEPFSTQTETNESSFPSQFTRVGNTVYFTAETSSAGRELWKTDGTASGTVLVKDIDPQVFSWGAASSEPALLTSFQDQLFFSASVGSNYQSLWRSDGTSAGTVKVRDFVSGGVEHLYVHDGSLYIVATDTTHGRELWKSAGTAASTVLVKDLAEGNGVGFSPNFFSFNNTLLFQSAANETWQTDGTAAGTILAPFNYLSYASNGLLATGGDLIFANYHPNSGVEPWVSDGTTLGTSILRDINTTNLSSVGSAQLVNTFLFNLNGIGYFNATNPEFGQELWRSDGSDSGTRIVADIVPGIASSYPADPSSQQEAFAWGDIVLFTTRPNLGNTYELWRSDSQGVQRLASFPDIFDGGNTSRPYSFIEFQGEVYFSGTSAAGYRELWKTNGTPEGTKQVKDIRPGTASSFVVNPVVFNESLFFVAYDSVGWAIWKSDGTDAGTTRFMDLDSTSLSAPSTQLTVIGETLYFFATTQVQTAQLWSSDGTLAGTAPVATLVEQATNTQVGYPTAVGNLLYFMVANRTLWRSDGTANGTYPLKQFSTGSDTFPDKLTAVGDKLYLVNRIGGDRGLWISDGTVDGTNLVSDDSGATDLIAIDSTLYFANGRNLRKSNGTAQTTVTVAEFATGKVENLTHVGDNILFFANDGIHGQELWRLPILTAVSDLQIDDVVISSTSGVIAETEFELSWQVTNLGEANTSRSWLNRVYLSSDDVVDGSDLVVAELVLGENQSLLVGQSIDVQLSFSIPLSLEYPDGQYRLLVRVDDQGVIPDTNRANNVDASTILSLELPPLPDLVIQDITAPSQSFAGRDIPISWTLHNAGDAPITGTWVDSVYLSSDNTIGDDRWLADFSFTGTIAPGQSIVRTQQLATRYEDVGQHRFVVKSLTQPGSNELYHQENNQQISAAITDLLALPVADLQVSQVSYGANLLSGSQASIEWTVTNHGNAATDASYWHDAIFVNSLPTLQGAKYLGQAVNMAALNPGDSYRNRLLVELPVERTGAQYLIVVSDYGDQVLELTGEGNNLSPGPITNILASPTPDLAATSISFPEQAFSGQTLLVQYRVDNIGQRLIGERVGWGDLLWLSDEPVINDRSQQLNWPLISRTLAPGESYTNQIAVKLPYDTTGDLFIVLVTDGWDDHFERDAEANNVIAKPITIRLTPPPDLEVVSVTAPQQIEAGSPIAVSYQVANNGLSDTSSARWHDALWFSADSQFDPATAVLIARQAHFGGLAVGQSVDKTIRATLPQEVAGAGFFFVEVNTNEVFTEVERANNFGSSATEIQGYAGPADLFVSSLTVPASGNAGQAALINWTVRNQGLGGTLVDAWTDTIILSADAVAGNQDDRIIGQRTHRGLLARNQSYTVENFLVELPANLQPGSYRIFVHTNSRLDVFEGFTGVAVDNNRITNAALTINVATGDLQTEVVTAPAVALAGSLLPVNWTVRNVGPVATQETWWLDSVYLSTDTILDSQDVLLGNRRRTNPLVPQALYQQATELLIPRDLQGSYYVIVKADGNEQVFEHSHLGETNNVAVSTDPIAISLPPVADLSVVAVGAPSTATSGNTIAVSWTVRNVGTAPAQGSWWDAVYVSIDQVFDPDRDHRLGVVVRDGALAVNQDYSRQEVFDLPVGLGGPYYVFVETDTENNLFEREQEANNVKVASTSTLVTARPLADLVAGVITIPATAVPGQVVSITYTVRNEGETAAVGRWQDSLFLSSDANWSIDDAFFGEVANTFESIPPGGSYSRTVSKPLPGVLPGEYFLIVRSDIRNVLPESDEGNNVSASLNSMQVNVPVLALGGAADITLQPGATAYYRLTTPVGATVRVSIDSNSTAAVENRVYVAARGIPSEAKHDFASLIPFAADQSLLIPKTQHEEYFIMVVAGRDAESSQQIRLSAEELFFSISDSGYGVGGNEGQLTLEINGAQFDPQVQAWLHGPQGNVVTASRVWPINETRLYATFDLRGLAAGSYAVGIENARGERAVLSSGLTVVPGGGSRERSGLQVAGVVRRESPYSFTLEWSNDGINDAVAPLLQLNSDIPFGSSPGNYEHPFSQILIAGNRADGPPGILRPGQVFSQIYFSQPQGESNLLTVSRLLANTSEAINWAWLMPEIEIAQASIGSSFDLREFLEQRVGNNGELALLLGELANLIPASMGSAESLPNLLALIPRFAQRDQPGTIAGMLQRADFATQIAGRVVQLQTLDGAIVDSTLAFNDGSFLLRPNVTGQYRIAVVSQDGVEIAVEPITIDSLTDVYASRLFIAASQQLSGTVSDAEQGTPLASATIELFLNGSRYASTTTSSLGQFELQDIAIGSYEAVVSRSGYARTILTNINFDGTPQSALAVSMQRQAELRLTTEDEQGQAQTGFYARLVPSTSLGNESSFYLDAIVKRADGELLSLSQLRAGNYRLTLFKDGFLPITLENISLEAGQLLDLGAQSFDRGLSISGSIVDHRDDTSGSLAVILRSSSDNVPVALLPVQNGQFSTTIPVPAGHYRLELTDPELIVDTLSVSGESGDEIDGLVLAIQPGAVIHGGITDTEANPLAGIAVNLLRNNELIAVTTTDAQGIYRFDKLTRGEYRVQLQDSGNHAMVRVENVQPDSEYIANLQASIGQTITGKVLDGQGNPVADAFVRLLADDHPIVVSQTDATGNYRVHLTSFFPTLRLVASHGSHTYPAIGVTAESDVVDFIPGTSTLLVGFSGLAIGDKFTGRVALMGPDGQTLSREVENVAEVTFHQLVTGSYTLRAIDSAGRLALRDIVVESGENSSQLRLLPSHKLSGTVHSEGTGDPAAKAMLVLVDSTTGEQILGFTDTSGRFEVNNLPAGEYLIDVLGSTIARQRAATITIPTSKEINLEIHHSDQSYAGRVIDGQGNPVGQATILVIDGSETVLATSISDWEGNFTVAYPGALPHELQLHASGFEPAIATPSAPGTLGNVSLRHIASGVTFGDLTTAPSGLPLGGTGEGEFLPIIQDGLFALFDLIFTPFKAGGHVKRGDLLNTPLDCGGMCVSQWSQAIRAIGRQDAAWEEYVDNTRGYRAAFAEQLAESTRLVANAIESLIGIISPFAKIKHFIFSPSSWVKENFLDVKVWQEIVLIGKNVFEHHEALNKKVKTLPSAQSSSDGISLTDEAFDAASRIQKSITSMGNILTNILSELAPLKKAWDITNIINDMVNAVRDITKFLDDYPEKLEKIRKALIEVRRLEELAEKSRHKYEKAVAAAQQATGQANLCIVTVLNDIERYCKREERPDDEDDRRRAIFVLSKDPNDIIGPDGYGPERWVSISDTLQYRIRFENDPVFATAPAQVVRITQQLDSDLDVRSFRLGSFGFGETVIQVPENRSFYSNRIDLTEQYGIHLDVIAGIDAIAGQAFWVFTSIDPQTGLRPVDPLAGFLPPNLVAPEGDGFVNYTIRARRTAVTGTRIDAQAQIVFDENEPIDTPPIFNTIDASAPTGGAGGSGNQPGSLAPASKPNGPRPSSGTNPPPTIVSPQSTFLVQWSSLDEEDGSAVASYDVYVSTNNEPYQIWLEKTQLTQAPFAGAPGNSYAFISVATDFAGQTAPLDANPQLIVHVPGPPAIKLLAPTILQVSEAGDAIDVGVRLESIPTGNVTLALSVSDSSEANVSVSSLTFTPSNWATPQYVRVTGRQDAIVDGNVSFNLLVSPTSNSAVEYRTLPPRSLPITNIDINHLGTISGKIWRDQNYNGIRDSVESVAAGVVVRLLSETGAVLRETISSSSGEYVFSALQPNKSYQVGLVLNSGVAVTLAKVGNDGSRDNDFGDNNLSELVSLATGQSIVLDAGLIQLGGLSGSVWHDANGDGVKVTSESSMQNQTVFIDTNSDGIFQIGEPSQLTDSQGVFRFANLRPGAYRVALVNDPDWLTTSAPVSQVVVGEGQEVSANPIGTRQDLRAEMVSIQQTGLATSEAGMTFEYQVRLLAAPSSPVIINAVVSELEEFSLSGASLTFDSANWNVPQTIRVSGIDDGVVDGDIYGRIELLSGATGDARFANWQWLEQTIVNLDDEVAGLALFQTDSSTFLSESGMVDQFAVRLSGRPTASVLVLLQPSHASIRLPGSQQLEFTPENWDQPQSVAIAFDTNEQMTEADRFFVNMSFADGGTAKVYPTLSSVALPLLPIRASEHQLQFSQDTAGFILRDAISNVVLRSGSPDSAPTELITGVGIDHLQIISSIPGAAPNRLLTGAGADVVQLNVLPDLFIDGGNDEDRLEIRFTAPSELLTVEQWQVTNFEIIDMRNSQPESLSMRAADVRAVSGVSDLGVTASLDVFMDGSDQWSYLVDWSIAGRGIVGDEVFHLLRGEGVETRLFNQRPWTNPFTAEDVNGDGVVNFLDPLGVINFIERQANGITSLDEQLLTTRRYYDVSGNGSITPIDALRAINYIERSWGSGRPVPEGEALTASPFKASQIVPREISSGLWDSPSIEDFGWNRGQSVWQPNSVSGRESGNELLYGPRELRHLQQMQVGKDPELNDLAVLSLLLEEEI